jgi:glycosyltransferase involved in cell wall biosynthesis
VGRLEPVKSFTHVVEVAANLMALSNISFQIVGDGPELNRISELVRHYNLNNVSIMPGSERIEKYYLDCDCILITSVSECFPMVLLEAMSFGLVPICYSDLDGPKDILDNNHNGFLVERFDFVGISKKILELSNDTSLLRRLSCNATNSSIKYSSRNVYPRFCSLLLGDNVDG